MAGKIAHKATREMDKRSLEKSVSRLKEMQSERPADPDYVEWAGARKRILVDSFFLGGSPGSPNLNIPDLESLESPLKRKKPQGLLLQFLLKRTLNLGARSKL